MRLSFYGAAHEVTGSCHFLECCGKRILIDCGLKQGRDEKTKSELPVAAGQIDFVILTHAHIDHTGRLPYLSREGFCGSVYSTDATADLCGIMLRDSAHIQEFEAEWRNRKGRRSGQPEHEPLYTMEDAENILKRFVPCAYERVIELCDGVSIRFRDIGHLLGSASVEVMVTEDGRTQNLLFSGDIGNINQPLIKDPSPTDSADYVIMESTYGDRLHNPPPDYAAELAGVMDETFDRGGNVVIPSFAVGRTQEILYFIRKIKENHLMRHDDYDVYVDSPLANAATSIFNENYSECFDEEAMECINRGVNPISFAGLKTAVTSEESRAINTDPRKKVIISASGMCEAGRIKHHLKHNLWRADSTVVFVGYQAEGTTGRAILNGAKTVKLLGEEIEVKAKIVQLEGISGHADRDALLKWVKHISPEPKHVFIVHGEQSVCEIFRDTLSQSMSCPVTAPFYTECWDLTDNAMIKAGVKPEPRRAAPFETEETPLFMQLKDAGSRLLEVISHNRGGANRDLKNFTAEIEELIKKWDR